MTSRNGYEDRPKRESLSAAVLTLPSASCNVYARSWFALSKGLNIRSRKLRRVCAAPITRMEDMVTGREEFSSSWDRHLAHICPDGLGNSIPARPIALVSLHFRHLELFFVLPGAWDLASGSSSRGSGKEKLAAAIIVSVELKLFLLYLRCHPEVRTTWLWS